MKTQKDSLRLVNFFLIFGLYFYTFPMPLIEPNEVMLKFYPNLVQLKRKQSEFRQEVRPKGA